MSPLPQLRPALTDAQSIPSIVKQLFCLHFPVAAAARDWLAPASFFVAVCANIGDGCFRSGENA